VATSGRFALRQTSLAFSDLFSKMPATETVQLQYALKLAIWSQDSRYSSDDGWKSFLEPMPHEHVSHMSSTASHVPLHWHLETLCYHALGAG
jgi:peptide methionine sulfoxide reductase MsrB